MKPRLRLLPREGVRVLMLGAVLVVSCSFSGGVPEAVATEALRDEALPDDAAMFVRSARSMELLQSGRDAILTFQLDRAEQQFAALARMPDGEIAAAYHLVTISLLKFMTSEEDAHHAEFVARSDAFKRLLADVPDSPWRAYLGAEANFQRALVYARRGSYLRAAFAARSAYGEYARLVERHPTFYDAYRGLGILHLGLGLAPGVYRRVLRFFGYAGSVEQGVEELRLAAEHSHFNREESGLSLALIDVKFLGSSGDGGRILEGLFRRYADSPLIAYVYGFYLFESRQAEQAERVLRKTADTYGTPAYFYIHYADYHLAAALFRQNRFDEAAVYYRRYLSRHAGPTLRASAILGLGLSLEMQGLREEAVAYYEQAEAHHALDSDAVALRQARRLQRAPLSDRERTLLLGRNAYDAGRYAEAHDVLRSVGEDPAASRDERAEAAYRRGRVFHAQGALDEALAAYGEAARRHEDPASRWGPWAQYYAGIIHEARSDAGAAARAFQEALAYKGPYDYQEALERNAKVALARVKRRADESVNR